MKTLVVDTDVISFLFKGDTRARLYRPHLRQTLPLVSFMTVAELAQWALIRNWGTRRKEQLEAHLLRYTLVPFDRALCQTWAEARYQAHCSGRKIETADAWVAATALLYNVPLVTHNRSHFDWLSGLTLISEAP
jgi:predicted nucleic acid-binding protein